MLNAIRIIAYQKFANHNLLGFDQKSQIIKSQSFSCNCPCRKPIEIYCVKCKVSVCKYCNMIEHAGHNKINLEELVKNKEQIEFKGFKNHLSHVVQNFNEFQNNMLGSFEKTFDVSKKELNELFYEIIDLLTKTKEKLVESSAKDYDFLKSQLNLIRHSLLAFNDDLEESNMNLHPNKIFELRRFFRNSLNSKHLYSKNLQIIEKANDKLNKIKEILISLKDPMQNFFKELQNQNLLFKLVKSDSLNPNENLFFMADPVKLLKKNDSLLLEKNTFGFGYFKSNLSDVFTLNNENFITWTGSKDDQQFYPIHIYNQTQKKKHQIIQKSMSAINVLSFFCKPSGEEILYSGDENGDLRIFEFDKISLKFEEEFIIHTKLKILEAILIEDLFNERPFKMKNDSDQYDKNKTLVIIGFTTKIPVRIYNVFGEIISFIPEFQQEKCGIMNYYYDELLLKTSIFLGFETCITQYDLKSNKMVMEFQTKKPVNAIRFLLDFHDEVSRLIIYAQNLNAITISSIDTGEVMQEVALNDVTEIYDICIWRSNENYLILVAEGMDNKNYIKILDFDDLEILHSKTKNIICPVNIRKTMMHDPKTHTVMESLVIFYDQEGDYSRIRIHQEEFK